MTEVTDIQIVAGRKLPSERVLLVLVVLLAALAASTQLVSSLWGTAKATFSEPYSLYRASVERKHLEEYNRRLTSELVALRSRNSQKSSAEQELESRLKALEEAVEGATSLGFMKRRRTPQTQVVARATDAKRTGPLAELLKDPQLAKGSRGKSATARRDSDIGGAEVPCADNICSEGARKKDISLSFPPSADRADTNSPDTGQALRDRFERAVDVLRFLPIGAPVVGEVSSEFGHRRSPFSRRASFHEGVDLRLRSGGRVVSTGAGTVTHVAYNSTYGLVVDIEHAPGLVSRYAHLAKALVRVGQVVSRGTLIALSGSTGRSTGPHLHYEILYRERPKNPRPFMELADNLHALGFRSVG
jgi:murein DD-endopeptidase MepM/ murein hydrolase activator NlpD